MKLIIQKGTTSKRQAIFVQNSSVTTGAGLSGLVFNSAGLAWYYWRENEGNAGGTAVTLATATRGTFASGGFIEKDSTNMPGFYEIGIPNAALATGAGWVVMVLRGATNMAPVTIEIQLVNFNPESGTNLGLSALPTANPAAANGLPTVGTGTGQLNPTSGNVTLAAATHTGATIPTVTTLTGHTAQTGDSFARIGANGSGLTDLATAANLTTALNRLGDYAGTGLNTVKGFLQALFRKDAGVSGGNLPSEINEIENGTTGNYAADTDSLEAIRDTAPLGTAMRGTDSAALASVCTEARLAELDGANLPTDVANVKTDTAAILTDTADMQPKLGAPAADISADIAALGTRPDLPSSTINDVSATTTVFVTNLTEITDDHYKDAFIQFTDNALKDQVKKITAYNGTTKAITCEALTEAPANGDAFVIINS